MSAGALQKALFDLLSQDPALTGLLGDERVHDAVPKNRKFPFLVIGDLTANDWSTSDYLGQAFIVTLRVWSSAQGRKEIYDICQRVRTLMKSDIQLPNGSQSHLVMTWPVSERFEREIAARSMRATLRFRILLEPKN
ncbi:DUF3168 domain-containing protein [Ahrensia marina]|uniref:DUF3168 domain-containing protein n=1 Tax=Ahrensia marina TaxID=1514904 RepID=UPI0006B4B0B4|nr:DUF3168 domain-containing protein [Ahrensia marina]